jgi:hypothetical protein
MKKRILFGYFLFFSLFCSGQTPGNVAEKDMAAYLFVYFTGNKVEEEAVHYAISNDGYRYWALNGNKPVID